MDRETLTSSQLARRAGVSVEALRFYERRGLLEPPPRTAAGYRQYPPQAVTRLLFIKRAQELGFTLREVAELASLRLEPGTDCGDVKRRAEGKLADIEAKIKTLQRMRKALRGLTSACAGRGPLSACPIIDALEPAERLGKKRRGDVRARRPQKRR